MKKFISIGVAATLMTGCASLFSTETQAVKINPKVDNQSISGVKCSVQNGRGYWMATGSDDVIIRRDSRPLAISCYNQNKTYIGSTSIASYYNTTNLWNIPLTIIPAAGIAGWVLDGTNGTANEYPASIDVNMHKTGAN